MRAHFLLVPAALIAGVPAVADEFATLGQAQQALFPGASFTPLEIILTESQVEQIIKASHAPMLHSKFKAWRVSTGGWFILDQVFGRDDHITYAIGLDSNGTVIGIEILVCLAEYQGVRSADWRQQFVGKSNDTAGDLDRDVKVISGTTLSSVHIAEGIKRVLATYALVLVPRTETSR